MSGLMLPASLLFFAFAPVLFLSENPEFFAVGVRCFWFLWGIALIEIPFHLFAIWKENLALKYFLQTHVKH
jgi:hypothetical protein